MNTFMNRKVLSIEERNILNTTGKTLFQLLYVQTDNGAIVPIWSLKEKHEFHEGDIVTLGLTIKKNKAAIHVIYP